MSFTFLQGATLIAAHATFTKIFLSFTLRTYQYLEWEDKRVNQVESNFSIQQFQKAQTNESEYAALLTAILLYLSTSPANTSDEPASLATTLVVVGQIGYVWVRTFLGYPSLPTITLALVRYGGLALLVSELWKAAF
jgi:hypothetical protein